MEEPGMIHTLIDEGDDSTFEIAVTRPAMDLVSGVPGISESEFVDRFADDIEPLVDDARVIGTTDAKGRILITAYWTQQLRPWLGGGAVEADLDAFGRPN